MVDKMKSKKAKKKKVKKMEQELVMRIMAIQENEDEASSREGSIHSLHDSDRVRLPTLHTIYRPADSCCCCCCYDMTHSLSLSLCRSAPAGGQRSGELSGERRGGHDGIQAIVRDVARGPLGCQHPPGKL